MSTLRQGAKPPSREVHFVMALGRWALLPLR